MQNTAQFPSFVFYGFELDFIEGCLKRQLLLLNIQQCSFPGIEGCQNQNECNAQYKQA